MRGRPWLRFVWVVLGFIALGFPVWHLTHHENAPVAEPEKSVRTTQEFRMDVTFATAPREVRLSYLGQTILQGTGPKSEFTHGWTTALPKEGADLLLKVQWPEKTPRTAVQIRVWREEEMVVEQTFWAEGALVEIVTVPGKSN